MRIDNNLSKKGFVLNMIDVNLITVTVNLVL
jgi:hypothetical protein